MLGVFLASGTVMVCDLGPNQTSSFHKNVSLLEQVDSVSHWGEGCSPVPLTVPTALEYPTIILHIRVNSLTLPQCHKGVWALMSEVNGWMPASGREFPSLLPFPHLPLSVSPPRLDIFETELHSVS